MNNDTKNLFSVHLTIWLAWCMLTTISEEAAAGRKQAVTPNSGLSNRKELWKCTHQPSEQSVIHIITHKTRFLISKWSTGKIKKIRKFLFWYIFLTILTKYGWGLLGRQLSMMLTPRDWMMKCHVPSSPKEWSFAAEYRCLERTYPRDSYQWTWAHFSSDLWTWKSLFGLCRLLATCQYMYIQWTVLSWAHRLGSTITVDTSRGFSQECPQVLDLVALKFFCLFFDSSKPSDCFTKETWFPMCHNCQPENILQIDCFGELFFERGIDTSTAQSPRWEGFPCVSLRMYILTQFAIM